MEKLVSEADNWAKGLWSKASESWENRSQDHNYRDLLTRPRLAERINGLPKIENGIFLDIGCGEGRETIYFCKVLAENGSTGRMYGFDTQKSFIDLASKSETSKISCTFGVGDFLDFLDNHNLTNKVDLVTSLFVLQDLPGIHNYLSNIHRALKERGTGLLLLVHPEFGEVMHLKGAVRINDKLNPPGIFPNWDFAAEYPIVEENGKTFYVPYFHRDIRKYRELLEGLGFKNLRFDGLKPNTHIIEKAKREGLSPFYNHEGNIYHPEIVEMNSSLIITVKK